MTPEVHAKTDDCVYSWSADDYSFGVTMYETFSGKCASGGLYSGGERGRRVCAGERPSLLGYISAFWKLLIEKCWHTDPDPRQSIDEILEEIIGGSELDRPCHVWKKILENSEFHPIRRSQRSTLERILRMQYSVEEFRKRVVICSIQSE